jgi:hypothetical protein
MLPCRVYGCPVYCKNKMRILGFFMMQRVAFVCIHSMMKKQSINFERFALCNLEIRVSLTSTHMMDTQSSLMLE